jgi:hypothetical protein
VDNIYEREFFYVLSILNSIKRICINEEERPLSLAFKRLLRALCFPKCPLRSIERLIKIENCLGVHSTYFLLEDGSFSRLGGRYRYEDVATKRISQLIINAGSEIAVHGAYYAFNDILRYRAQKKSFEYSFNKRPLGIRNHDLRHDGLPTWIAQRDAGYIYDASFGDNSKVGNLLGQSLPFSPFGNDTTKKPFIVLPLTIQDSTLRNHMRKSASEAFEICKRVALEVEEQGGLLTLLWHNDFFDEPEYAEWEQLYSDLVEWLMKRNPWNATGIDIAQYWIKNHLGV